MLEDETGAEWRDSLKYIYSSGKVQMNTNGKAGNIINSSSQAVKSGRDALNTENNKSRKEPASGRRNAIAGSE